MKNGGYLRWILLAAANHERFSHPDSLPYRIEIVSPTGDDAAEEAENTIRDTDMSAEKAPEITDAEYDRMLCERFDYTYPHMAAARLPAKLSGSSVKPCPLGSIVHSRVYRFLPRIDQRSMYISSSAELSGSMPESPVFR